MAQRPCAGATSGDEPRLKPSAPRRAAQDATRHWITLGAAIPPGLIRSIIMAKPQLATAYQEEGQPSPPIEKT